MGGWHELNIGGTEYTFGSGYSSTVEVSTIGVTTLTRVSEGIYPLAKFLGYLHVIKPMKYLPLWKHLQQV